MYVPPGMPVYVLFVAVLSATTVIALARGAQALRHFGWNTRRGLWGWYGILVGLYSAYVASNFIHVRPPSLIAVAVGLVGGALVLGAVRPRWPVRLPGRARWILSLLGLACLLGIAWVIAPHPAHLLEGGGALIAFSFILLFTNRGNTAARDRLRGPDKPLP